MDVKPTMTCLQQAGQKWHGALRQLTFLCMRVKQNVRSLPGGRAALCRGFSLNTILASSVHSCTAQGSQLKPEGSSVQGSNGW